MASCIADDRCAQAVVARVEPCHCLPRGGDALLKDAVPFWVRRFAAGERDGGDGVAKGANDVWRGQFDHSAHATGAQMVVGDHELHGRGKIGMKDEG